MSSYFDIDGVDDTHPHWVRARAGDVALPLVVDNRNGTSHLVELLASGSRFDSRCGKLDDSTVRIQLVYEGYVMINGSLGESGIVEP